MNLKKRIPILLLISVLLLALAGCGTVKGTLVMGDTYRLESGKTLDDDLTVMGGVADVEAGSTVDGDVSVMGGTLNVDGTVTGNVSVMGGSVNLGDNAVVEGDVSQIGGSISKAEGAVVKGDFNDKDSTVTIPDIKTPRMGVSLDPIIQPFVAFFQALAVAALAVLVYLFAARPMERVGQAVFSQPVVSGGIGLLTIIVAPALLLILGITIILLPISLLGILLAAVAWLFGWVTLGWLTGRQVARMLNQNWTEPINAGVGTLVISLVSSLFGIIPCIGWIPGFIAGVIGLGAVVVTRFGMQTYTGETPLFGGTPRSGSAPFGGPSAGPQPTPPYTPAPPSQYSAAPQHPIDVPPAPAPAEPPAAPAPDINDFFGSDLQVNATFVTGEDEEKPSEDADKKDEGPVI